MDFGVIQSICHVMDEQELRGQFTDIGSIMEDASVIALVWMRDETLPIRDRTAKLRDAYNKIGALLDNIEVNVR